MIVLNCEILAIERVVGEDRLTVKVTKGYGYGYLICTAHKSYLEALKQNLGKRMDLKIDLRTEFLRDHRYRNLFEITPVAKRENYLYPPMDF